MKKILLLSMMVTFSQAKLANEFCYVDSIIQNIALEIRYVGEDNFLGEVVDGYLAPRAILTKKATHALKKVQKELNGFGLGLKIFDAYRPQKAVDHFVRWGRDLLDTKMKAIYYPSVEKRHLFRDGYIAKKSGHSRGSTVDVSIIDLSSGEELDMGSSFDFFGKLSWVKNREITSQQRANRMLLNSIMLKHGFKSYAEEWWHFTLKNEPYKNRYFNFNVE